MVRCKLKLTEIRSYASTGKTLVFTAQYDPTIPEDQRFAKASPSGRFEIYIDNPPAIEEFKLGESYYFDAIPAAAPAAPEAK
jgi:hypothetical protein